MELTCSQANARTNSHLDRPREIWKVSGYFGGHYGSNCRTKALPNRYITPVLIFLFFSIFFLAKSTKLQPKCTDWKDVQITLKQKQKQPTNNWADRNKKNNKPAFVTEVNSFYSLFLLKLWDIGKKITLHNLYSNLPSDLLTLWMTVWQTHSVRESVACSDP